MKRYITPDFKMIHFEVEDKMMDGYNDGDVNPNPWDELFTDDTSTDDISSSNALKLG